MFLRCLVECMQVIEQFRGSCIDKLSLLIAGLHVRLCKIRSALQRRHMCGSASAVIVWARWTWTWRLCPWALHLCTCRHMCSGICILVPKCAPLCRVRSSTKVELQSSMASQGMLPVSQSAGLGASKDEQAPAWTCMQPEISMMCASLSGGCVRRQLQALISQAAD